MPHIDIDAICAERKIDRAKIDTLLKAALFHRQQTELHIRLIEIHLGVDVDELDLDDEILLECSPDDIIERLDVQGGSKGEIYKSSDAMGRIYIKGKGRALNFSPSDTAFGKNPGQLDILEVPHPTQAPRFLADVIQSIKDNLNQMTEEQIKAQQILEDWRAKIEQLDTVDEFNDTIEEIKLQSITIQSLFATAAKSKKYTFDKESSRYVA
jgi:hypothetical protein